MGDVRRIECAITIVWELYIFLLNILARKITRIEIYTEISNDKRQRRQFQ